MTNLEIKWKQPIIKKIKFQWYEAYADIKYNGPGSKLKIFAKSKFLPILDIVFFLPFFFLLNFSNYNNMKVNYNNMKVSYAIGISHPLSITVISYGSSPFTEAELLKIVNDNFDLRPGILIRFSCHYSTCWNSNEK